MARGVSDCLLDRDAICILLQLIPSSLLSLSLFSIIVSSQPAVNVKSTNPASSCVLV